MITLIQLNYKHVNADSVKGTVSIISSAPSCKDDNARFTTLKALPDKVWFISIFIIVKNDYS